MGTIEIEILRSIPTIEYEDRRLRPKSRKAEALLLYVFLSGERSFRRDFLASLFWEDHDLSMARDNLRQVLVRIKKTCGPLQSALTIDRSVLEVDTSKVHLDIDALIDAPDTFLAQNSIDFSAFDFDAPFAQYLDIGSSFRSWICVLQSAYQRKLATALHGVLHAGQLPPQSLLNAALLMQKLDPTDEISCRFLMQHYARCGRSAEALKVYNTLYELLDESYDVEPSEETIELNAAIKMGEFSTVPVSIPVPIGPSQNDDALPDVFVADFDIDDKQDRTVRLGKFFRAEILGNLSKFREWNVLDVAPQTADHYRLECIIEDHGEEIDTILSLRQAEKGRVLWSQRMVVGFHNWRDTQWRIAQQIALAIDQTLTTDRLTSTLNERPQDRSSFDKWTICASLNAEWSPASADKMNQLLKEILETSPRFGLAHVYLAAAYNKRHLVYPGVFRDQEAVKAAMHHGHLAMEIDTLDSQSHRVFAWAKALNGEFDVAEFHFQQSYDLNPANLHVRASAALGFAFLDNTERACDIADRTVSLSPNLHPFHWGYLQNIYYLSNRLVDARMAGELAGNAISNLPAWQSAILSELGEFERATEYRKRFLDDTRARWQGSGTPTEQQVFGWFLQCFPLKNAAQKERLAKHLLLDVQPT